MRWFRMHSEVRRDPKVQTLPGELFKAWVNFMCFACEHQGYLPATREMAWELRVTEHKIETAVVALIDRGLIEDRQEGLYLHNWNVRQFESDSSTERVREHRKRSAEALQKRAGNVSGNADGTGSDNRVQNTETETPGDVSEFDRELERVASKIHGRHPPHRRCSPKMVQAKLRIIAKREPPEKRIDRLRQIDTNHAAWCLYWGKDNGTFAKALENWLAPTMGRFDEEPPVLFSVPAPSNPPRLVL